jgi:hypothetical protein
MGGRAGAVAAIAGCLPPSPGAESGFSSFSVLYRRKAPRGASILQKNEAKRRKLERKTHQYTVSLYPVSIRKCIKTFLNPESSQVKLILSPTEKK